MGKNRLTSVNILRKRFDKNLIAKSIKKIHFLLPTLNWTFLAILSHKRFSQKFFMFKIEEITFFIRKKKERGDIKLIKILIKLLLKCFYVQHSQWVSYKKIVDFIIKRDMKKTEAKWYFLWQKFPTWWVIFHPFFESLHQPIIIS